MQPIHEYLRYAETALAAYALGLVAEDRNKRRFKEKGMAEDQALKFDAKWKVLAQSPEQLNGYSALLLQDSATGEKVLANQGTENCVADYLTDIVDISLLGSAANMPQYIALNNLYQSLIANDQLSSAKVFNATSHSLGRFLA
jgi:hypothetical protein